MDKDSKERMTFMDSYFRASRNVWSTRLVGVFILVIGAFCWKAGGDERYVSPFVFVMGVLALAQRNYDSKGHEQPNISKYDVRQKDDKPRVPPENWKW